jgi:hypothetical protein
MCFISFGRSFTLKDILKTNLNHFFKSSEAFPGFAFHLKFAIISHLKVKIFNT